ncbi:ATPase, T2SS/T4P/T4SS family [Micromonospora vinacea]|uniref:CpaF family protein n=1 Tax=Micromonospora vinacea TaxID=709878 RepID=UPI003454A87A
MGDVDLLISNALDEYARDALHRGQPPLSETAEHRIRQALRNSFVGAGGLQPLLDDEAIETININGCDNVQVQYRNGRRARVAAVAHSDAELIEQLRDMGARLGAHERRFDPDAPELAMQLPGGARLHAMQVISDRVAVSIRRHPMVKVSLDDLVGMGELTPTMADLFTGLVLARRNIVISGGPAAGKTTFLRALASAIPVQERLIVIEDSRELSLDPQVHPDMISMQARQANIEGVGEFSLDQCVRAALRLTPDRVILGEVRGAEVVQMAKAMSIGVDGSMATVHASSSSQALLRMTTYAMEPPASYPRSAATSLLGEAVHMVVHLDRTPNGLRVVSSVREIVGRRSTGTPWSSPSVSDRHDHGESEQDQAAPPQQTSRRPRLSHDRDRRLHRHLPARSDCDRASRRLVAGRSIGPARRQGGTSGGAGLRGDGPIRLQRGR